ncbi:MAG: hypothetical protein CVU97_03200 [Firmicutes bacterium HGW-Firmicutes-21]|nr:MAG: hypothetical protein CVU97_03200 [Firmicutes bacterium HGW-Firmicutes-21]
MLIGIHEAGHYLVGWFLGIPRKRMKIRIKKMIPQVLLISDTGKRVSSVDTEEYTGILEQYINSDNKIFLFVVGGHVFELLTISAAVSVSLLLDASLITYFANAITWIAPLMMLNYLIFDIIGTKRRKGSSGGDFSGSWEISPIKTIFFYSAYLIVLVLTFLLVRLT